jgi:indole-3-glycerol phosphate synthase
MADFLEQMAASSRARAAVLDERWDAKRLDRPVFPLVLDRFDLIAEIKDHSPAEGRLARAGAGRAERALAYAEGGAAAISVLTEPERFAGGLEHLDEIVSAVEELRVPVMRKDFLTDVRQVSEARAHGASGVLLITAILDDALLERMLGRAYELGMFVLLESFDEDDLMRSARLLEKNAHADRAADRQLLFGINTRNLRSLEVDPDRLESLAPSLPAEVTAVAESGLKGPADTARVASQGYAVGLVGTALMRSDDPRGLVAAMLEAGRLERGA